MVEKLWHHLSSVGIAKNQSPVDDPWKYNVRSQIFCKNQEEYDYLSSLNLMHGKDIEINIWDEWLGIRQELKQNNARYPRVLPSAYTTWHCNLRGM